MSAKETRQSAWAAASSLGAPGTIATLFAADPERGRRFSFEVGDLLVDVSKQRWDETVRSALLRIANGADVTGGWREMRSGRPINLSEGRPVGHTWLRSPRSERTIVDGVDVVAQVNDALDRMLTFVDDVHEGRFAGRAGERFTDVVNIGIGGSDLGPRLAYEALRAFRLGGVRCHFVSNIDPANAADVLSSLDPARTLVVVASKTFTTEETMANARRVRTWLSAGGDPARQMCAVTADPDQAALFGIAADRCFPFWPWVGGRFSLASSIGLPVALAVGSAAFRDMLMGQRIIDEHVDRAEPAANVPLAMALIGVWNSRALGIQSKAVVPYSYDLRSLPAFLQQLEMESNGKSVHRDGTAVDGPTAPIVWGSAGTDAQHAYFQLLHQGTQSVAIDFLGFANGSDEPTEQHDALFANLLAQSRALAFGRPDSETDALASADHRRFPGNRPNTVIVAPRLTPSTFGQIVALYEHVVFFQGWLWNINSFDQFGVELGKQMAVEVRAQIEGRVAPHSDSSTRRLTEWFHRHRSTAGG
ncbi:MAG: hypothetical protein RL391_692 [Actinomycetota bacterium]|jgi:glucose-6-phosphate isomerase